MRGKPPPITRQVGKLAHKVQQALSFHRQGFLIEAEKTYASILAKHPAHFEVLHLFGILRMQQGRTAEALDLLTAALRQRPSSPEALSNTAAVLMALDRHQEALAKLDESLSIKPGDADAHFNRGVALTHLGRQGEALASYQETLSIRPDHVAAAFNLGNLLSTGARYEDAMACYDKVLAAVPHHLEARNNRGNVLSKLGRHQDAVGSYNQVLAINPNYLNALVNRGSALKELSRYDEALADYERVLAVHPHHVDTLYNRGNGLVDLARPEEAIASFRRALAVKPDDPTVHTGLIFALNFDAGATAEEQQAERARWHERHARPFAGVARTHGNAPDPRRRLRVGYVGPYFRHQAATYAFAGVLLCHDRERFEVICYSDTVKEDDVTARLQACAGAWRRTAELSDDQLAELIRSDDIDILVDLAGHMRGHRLLVFARKPAPIQVTAWGEPTGTGLKAMDYLLADPVLVPQVQRTLLAEQVIDLPNFLGYWTPETLPTPGALPALERGYVTFGSFNRAEKILNPVLRCWARILCALPESRLVLKDRLFANPNHRARIADVLAEEGIATERVTLLGSSDRSAHFATYQTVDIALDPFPHGGGMTTLDALWMGLPVVTWAGPTISARLAAASLTAVGLTEFIAPNPDEYARVAIEKAADLDELVRLRASLRTRVADSPVGNPARYARAVETAYCQMWERWCAAVADGTASQPAPIRSMELSQGGLCGYRRV